MRITSLSATPHRLPLPRRAGKVPLTGPTPTRSPETHVEVLTVRVDTDGGVSGLGYVPTLAGDRPSATLATLQALVELEIAPLLAGESAHQVEGLWAKAAHHFRAVGFAGLAARAYCAVDLALWDAKAKAAGVPLATLWGGGEAGRASVDYIVSDPAGAHWDADDVAAFTKAAIQAGASGVRVEVGTSSVQADADRVRDLHDALGDEVWMGVAAGGRYDLSTALALAQFLEDQRVDWFEDPIPLSDAAGYARLADRLELPVAVGSTCQSVEEFYAIIRDGRARVVRPDAARLGGATPVRRIAAVASAYQVAVAPVRMPELGVHLAHGVAGVSLVDAVGWLAALFPRPAGFPAAPGAAGLGLTPGEPGT